MTVRTPLAVRQHAALAPKQIDITSEYELQYWSRALGTNRDALIEAVMAVGPAARLVSRQLGKG